MLICEKGMHCVDCPIIHPEDGDECAYIIEVEPVKRGEWVQEETDSKYIYRCSHCKEVCDQCFIPPAYCMHCGATMKLSVDVQNGGE